MKASTALSVLSTLALVQGALAATNSSTNSTSSSIINAYLESGYREALPILQGAE
jgi:hypothetical protein